MILKISISELLASLYRTIVPRVDMRHTQSEPQCQAPMPLLLSYALSGETELFCLLDLKEQLLLHNFHLYIGNL